VDDKVLEDIKFHQDVVNKDASSPLYQIREKEMEISGRVLAARGEADKILSDSRKKAAGITEQAEVDAKAAAKARVVELMETSKQEAAEILKATEDEVASLTVSLREHHDDAVSYIVGLVTAS